MTPAPLPVKTIRLGNALQAYHVYVPRIEEEAWILREVARTGWFSIHGCRTQGKTSTLLHLGRTALEDLGVVLLRADCAAIETRSTDPPSLDEWTSVLCRSFESAAAAIEGFQSPSIRSDVDPKRRLVDYFRGCSIPGRRIFFVIDEIDYAVLKGPSGIPGLLRATAAETNPGPSGPSFAIVGLRCLQDYADIETGDASSIGQSLEMGDFRPDSGTVDFLAGVLDPRRLSAESSGAAIRKLLDATGGQPLLTMTLLQHSIDAGAQTPDRVAAITGRFVESQRWHPQNEPTSVASASLPPREPLTPPLDAIHRACLEDRGTRSEVALASYELLLRGKGLGETDPGGRNLMLWGLCRRGSGGLIELKGRIFREIFDQVWLDVVREQRQAQRSVLRPARNPGRGKPPNVYVINTGGTLGMVRRPGPHPVVGQPEDWDEFWSNFQAMDDLVVGGEQPFARDSINITPEDWVVVAETIRRLHARHPAWGFVVVHGTDTMAFTASAIAFAFGQALEFPIVFTGSQTTPDVLHGDAHTNLRRACLVAREGIPEVVIAFGDSIHRAVRARKRDERQFNGFESVGIPPIGDLSERVEFDRVRTRPCLPVKERAIAENLREAVLPGRTPSFTSRLLTIQLIPGLEPGSYRDVIDRRQCDGVVIQVLGAGNVTSEGRYGFHSLIARATTLGIPVLLTSHFHWRSGFAQEYKPAAGAIDVGAIAGGEMTPEAAITKFRWALAAIDAARVPRPERVDAVRTIMTFNIVGELDGPIIPLLPVPYANPEAAR